MILLLASAKYGGGMSLTDSLKKETSFSPLKIL